MSDPTQSSAPNPQSPIPTPLSSRLRNSVIALAAIVLSVLLVIGVRGQGSPSLANLVGRSMPLEVALSNGKPTLIEFYADWCSSCQAMVPTVTTIEQSYRDRLNFVMLNVDNDKWLPEVLSYRVDGIPHFAYVDGTGTAIASTIGEQPEGVLSGNLDALIAAAPLPYLQAGRGKKAGEPGRTSDYSAPVVPTGNGSDPRSHGSQVKP
jgi:thiol-disulfide isomerase/thioredoxin